MRKSLFLKEGFFILEREKTPKFPHDSIQLPVYREYLNFSEISMVAETKHAVAQRWGSALLAITSDSSGTCSLDFISCLLGTRNRHLHERRTFAENLRRAALPFRTRSEYIFRYLQLADAISSTISRFILSNCPPSDAIKFTELFAMAAVPLFDSAFAGYVPHPMFSRFRDSTTSYTGCCSGNNLFILMMIIVNLFCYEYIGWETI